jgi:pyrroloquinoline quinone biosynthesis protein B
MGGIARFATLDVQRKVGAHINNSNSILIADSSARRAVEVAGWEVAQDGFETHR